MEIKRNGSQSSQSAPAEHLTGSVRIDPLFQPSVTQRALGAYVTFESCVRNGLAHAPDGADRDLHVRIDLVQSWGGPLEAIRSGDVVWTPPDEKHWHGATPNTAITPIVIAAGVAWLEKMTDEPYRGTNSQGVSHAEA